MNAKQYLSQIQRLETAVAHKKAELEMLRQSAQGIKSIDYSAERVQSSKTQDTDIAALIMKILDTEKSILGNITELTEKRHKIIDEIDRVENTVLAEILFKRYVEGKQLDLIAKEMHYEYGSIRQMHGKALKEFETTNTN